MVCLREITREDVGGRELDGTREGDVINAQDVFLCLKKGRRKKEGRGEGGRPRICTLPACLLLPDQSPC